MATATLPLSTPLAAAPAAPRKGLLARFYDALIEARMRQAMREISLHRHLLVPQDEVKKAGYTATYANAGLLPFVRGA